jgi:hypothetical protein
MKLTKAEADVLTKAIWDAVEAYIDDTPTDGINAGGEFSPAVYLYQRKYIDGMRAARVAAMSAVRAERKAPAESAP